MYRCCLRSLSKSSGISRCISNSVVFLNRPVEPTGSEPWIPPFEEKYHEPVDVKKARLTYQSRKRGMLENDLLLSTFVAKYLNTMTDEQLAQYDRLINLPSNDWDIFYWAAGVKPTPEEFDNEIMNLLKEHLKNKDRLMRIRQPDLH